MKKLFSILTVATLALGLAACNNDKGGDAPYTGADGNNVTLSFSGMNGAGSDAIRGIDTPADQQKTTFSTGQVVFTKGGKVTSVYTVGNYSGTNDLANFKVDVSKLTAAAGVTFTSISADKVYVFGNTAAISAIVKDANIATVLAANSLPMTVLGDGTYANAPLFGSTTIKYVTNDGANPIGTEDYWAVVDIRPVISRIEIGEISDKGSNKFQLVGIWVNNYYTSLTLNPAFDGTAANRNTGNAIKLWMDNSDLGIANYPGSSSALHQVLNSAAANSVKPAVGKVWAFNVFPGVGATNLPHILLHFKGCTDAAGVSLGRNPDDVYVTISKYTGTTEFKAGYVYTIGNLQWDAGNNGTNKIEEEYIDCDLKVNVIKWEAATLTPQVN